jgi:hypothetical protein
MRLILLCLLNKMYHCSTHEEKSTIYKYFYRVRFCCWFVLRVNEIKIEVKILNRFIREAYDREIDQ